MNNQQNKTNRKNKKPYHLFTYFCLLLAVASMCMGSTFARYVTSSQGGANVGVAHLACSFSVDEVSSTTFSNSNYWLTIDKRLQAQNHPREIVFSLHNYQKNADGTNSDPSEIDLQSTFRFFAPKEFLENIAFQFLKKGDGNTRIPLTQQYVLSTIIEKAEANTKQISTSDFTMNIEGQSKPADYGEYTGASEETLTLSNQGFNKTNGTGKIVAIAQAENVQVATISLTAEMRKNINYEITQVRGNIVNAGEGTTETTNDMSAPEYYGIYNANEMVYFCLDITLPSMTLQAKKNADGTFMSVDDNFIFAFTIIGKDDFNTDTDKKIAERFNVKGISLYSDNALTTFAKAAVVKVENSLDAEGKITSSKYHLVENAVETEFVLDGNAVKLKDDNNTIYYVNDFTKTHLNNSQWNPFVKDTQSEDVRLPYRTGASVRKVFQTDMRVLFTQAS